MYRINISIALISQLIRPVNKEKDGYMASGDHFGYGDSPVYWYVFEPYRQAALDLDGCGVGGAVEGLQDSFYYHG